MKLLTAIFFLFVAAQSFGSEDLSEDQTPITICKTGESINDSLSEDQSIYLFTFKGLKEMDSTAIVAYQVDGLPFEKELSSSMLKVETTPGKHVFEFSVLTNQFGITYMPISSDSLGIEEKMEASYRVQLTAIQTFVHVQPMDTIQIINVAPDMINRIEVCKPVIYLYPEERTDATVSVDIKGNSPFYYPAYKDNWSVTAHPNGDLTIADETYRYLFWESTDKDYLTSIEVNEGFSVEGSNTISFLEDKLTTFGLTAAERADFITYWGPKMAANEQNLVRFEWNEQCDQFAKLSIIPKPNHVYRLYIFIAPLDSEIDIQPQVIPSMERNGFTVIEWGGQMSNYQPNKTL